MVMLLLDPRKGGHPGSGCNGPFPRKEKEFSLDLRFCWGLRTIMERVLIIIHTLWKNASLSAEHTGVHKHIRCSARNALKRATLGAHVAIKSSLVLGGSAEL